MTSSEEPFRTANTALAAYLMSEDLGLPKIVYINDTKAYFVFDDTKANLESYINAYDEITAIGNIRLFFNFYQSLLRRIHEKH